MPTGQTIINNALIALGILEQGGTPSVSDSVDALTELNTTWDAWSIDEGMIYALIAQRFPLTANIAFYTIGPGGAFNTQIPARIYQARFATASGGAIASSSIGNGGLGYAVNDTGVIPGANGTTATYIVTSANLSGAVTGFTVTAAGTGYNAGYGYSAQTGGAQPGGGSGFTLNILTVTAGGMNRNPLQIVEASAYYGHHDLQASALTPDELYPDYNPDVNGLARLFLFPVPNSTGTLELDTAVPFTVWSLTGNYVLPPGFQDPLQYALAWRLLPRYGAIVAQQVAEVIGELGQKSEQRILAANAINRQRPIPQPAPQPQESQPK